MKRQVYGVSVHLPQFAEKVQLRLDFFQCVGRSNDLYSVAGPDGSAVNARKPHRGSSFSETAPMFADAMRFMDLTEQTQTRIVKRSAAG